jgi:cytosine/uracil/thiamine/allantoin permease
MAVACVLAVLVGGILSVLLVHSWLIRREKTRWEAWPVDWTGDLRRAPRG